MPGTRGFLLGGLLALAGAAAAVRAQAPAAPAPEPLAGLRQRLGIEALARMPGGLRLTGRSEFRGAAGTFEMLLAGDGRFRRSMAGPVPHTWAWDGTEAWERDWTGMPGPLVLADREVALLTHWGLTGLWLLPALPLEIRTAFPEGGGDAALLRLRLEDGVGEARLRLGSGGLPAGLEVDGPGGPVIWTLEDWRQVAGFRYPGRLLSRAPSGRTSRLEVEEAAPAPAWLRDPYAMPPARPRDLFWDPKVPPELEVRRVPSGHLLVRGRLGDGVPRWFLFDTGAGSDTLDRSLAADLGLPIVGSIPVRGAGGTVPAHFCQGTAWTLGPARWESPVFLTLDLAAIGGFFQVELAGIVGCGFLSRLVAEVVPGPPAALRIHPPGSPALPRESWTPLLVVGRRPVLRARFEGDHEGFFLLDTGSGDHVVLFPETVARDHLLEGRATRPAMSGGVGGVAASRQGRLAWFELGGRRFLDVPTTFAVSRKGALHDPWLAGLVGSGLLARFRVILDYPERRIALLPRTGAGDTASRERKEGGTER